MIILHSTHSAESRAFVEAYGEGNFVLDWYGDNSAYNQYMLSGNPSPSGFPFVVYKDQGFVNPESPQWVEDEVKGLHKTEQQILDGMIILSKLKLMRALNALNLWKPEVKPLIKGNEDFEDAWDNAVEIDLNDPLFQQGFALTSIDMDTVKRKIIEMEV